MLAKLRTTALACQIAMVQPFRQRRLRQLCLQGAAPIFVLFYHRVADRNLNAWSISTKKFLQHLDMLQNGFELIDLAEVQRRVRYGDSNRPGVHVTFDDGYSENCDVAIPELIRRKIPCTYFVTLHNIVSGESFEHDRRRGLPIQPNTLEQIRWMASQGIEIGAHTRNHRDLGQAPLSDINDEIINSTVELAQLIARPIRYFAFPYGMPANMPAPAIADVIASGMKGFCSAFGGYNLPGRDWFHIRRIHGDPELPRLKNWLSFDTRKLRLEPTLSYSLPSV